MPCADPFFQFYYVKKINLNCPGGGESPPTTRSAHECRFILNSNLNLALFKHFIGKLRGTKGRNTRQSETEACFRPGQYLGGTIQVWNLL